MKTSADLFDRLATDEAFAKEFAKAVSDMREAGAMNSNETILSVAEGFGYSVSKEELDKIIDEQDSELSEEELGKVAGGTSCALAVLTFSCLGVTAASIIYESVRVAEINSSKEKYKDYEIPGQTPAGQPADQPAGQPAIGQPDGQS